MPFSRATLAFAAAVAAALGGVAIGTAAPAAKPAKPLGVVFRYPKQAEHTSFVIEINAKGQTSKVRSVQHSNDSAFDTLLYGNVVQTFVRTPDGRAIAGVYRMSYDYNPANKHIRRTVTLIHAGGVDPDAESMVDRMINANRLTSDQIERDIRAAEAAKKPTPKPTKKP